MKEEKLTCGAPECGGALESPGGFRPVASSASPCGEEAADGLGGWVKLPRWVLRWSGAREAPMLSLLVHLMGRVRLRPVMMGRVSVEQGEVGTSLTELSAVTGIGRYSLRSCLRRMEAEGLVSVRRAGNLTLVRLLSSGEGREEVGALASRCIPLASGCTPPASGGRAACTGMQPLKEKFSPHTPLYKESYEEGKKAPYAGLTSSGGAAGAGEAGWSGSLEPSVDLAASGAASPEGMQAYYNHQLQEAGSGMVRAKGRLSGQRRGLIRARLREHGAEAVQEVVRRAARSAFLGGGGSRGFVADLSWIMRPENFRKVLEGLYDDRPANRPITSNPYSHDYRQNPREAQLADAVRGMVDFLNAPL